MTPAHVQARTVLQVLAVVGAVLGQAPAYEWGFTNTVSQSLELCAKLPITVTPTATNGTALGVPPYYLISFAAGASGTPMTSLIGSNASALAWTVAHPVGSQLILEVVDSAGTSGGTDIPLYTVVGGTSTSCLPKPPTNEAAFTVSSPQSNDSTLNTCDVWTLFVKGGKPPYSASFAAVNSTGATNVSMGPEDTWVQYVNRANPGSQMIAAISDSTGRWATGSPLVKTAGSTNVECNGLGTVSGMNATFPGAASGSSSATTTASSTSSTVPGQASLASGTPGAPSSSSSSVSAAGAAATTAPKTRTSESRRTPAIIGGTLGALLVIIILTVALCHVHILRQRQRQQRGGGGKQMYASPMMRLSIPSRMPSSATLDLNSPATPIRPVDGETSGDGVVTPFVISEADAHGAGGGRSPNSKGGVSRGTSASASLPGSASTAATVAGSNVGVMGDVVQMEELPPPPPYAYPAAPAAAANNKTSATRSASANESGIPSPSPGRTGVRRPRRFTVDGGPMSSASGAAEAV
uniref:Uncharacterized protein n=1 Tax=Mycena chlorophos TaxID=658473 RepID=A0ABQ0L8K0_MYCCL|nr:predicted protein [Mycena chlorophos]